MVLFMLVRRLDRQSLVAQHRRVGWLVFAGVLLLALLAERRLPQVHPFYSGQLFRNWSRTIFELVSLSPIHSIWLQWAGWLLIAAPVLLWFAARRKQPPPLFIVALLAVTYLLTIWQARWAYFFSLLFVLAVPAALELFQSRLIAWSIFVVSIFPILRAWDEQLWPDEAEYLRRVQQRNESAQLHDLAVKLQSATQQAFLAQWWLSPEIAYWSGQPAVAGSSHESLPGTADSARFFVSQDWENAREILARHRVGWIIIYDCERAAQNSAAVLGLPPPPHAICSILDRTPTHAPPFLSFAAQTGTAKLYRVVSNR
jgi:hypothetical protein